MKDSHLQSLRIQNYRCFSKIEIEHFSLVNVIGGPNGVGKSSILEAIFHLVDKLNPTSIFRPFQWRQIPLSPSDNLDALKQTYFNRNTKKTNNNRR